MIPAVVNLWFIATVVDILQFNQLLVTVGHKMIALELAGVDATDFAWDFTPQITSLLQKWLKGKKVRVSLTGKYKLGKNGFTVFEAIVMPIKNMGKYKNSWTVNVIVKDLIRRYRDGEVYQEE